MVVIRPRDACPPTTSTAEFENPEPPSPEEPKRSMKQTSEFSSVIISVCGNTEVPGWSIRQSYPIGRVSVLPRGT